MKNITAELSAQKASGKKIIGCFPLYPPVELFAAMGLLPFVLWNLKDTLEDLAEADRHIQNYACGIARELTQFTLGRTRNLLDGIFSYNACDTLRNLPEILATGNTQTGRTIPMLRLHVPQVNRSQSRANGYFETQITRLIKTIEDAFDLRFSPDAFARATEAYAKMRALCREAEQHVARGELSFESFCKVVLSNYALPVEEQIRKLTSLLDSSGAGNPKGGRNVMVSGIMPPPPPVIRAMEQNGLRVAANDIASLHRSYAFSPDTTPSPAAFYVDYFNRRFPCTTLLYKADERVEAFLHIAREANVEGVIFAGEKFCEYEYFEFPYLEKRLKEIGIPALFLEFCAEDTDHIDAYATRVAAFAEMLAS